MRDMHGLVDSLVTYIEQEDKPDDKVTFIFTTSSIVPTLLEDFLRSS